MIEENQGGYITIAYNFDMLVKWTRKVKAIQTESYKNEIPDDVMELAEEVLNHSFYDLDMDVYALAEMGKDWLKDYLQELNDKDNIK